MKYYIDYQFMANGADRPSDDGQVVGIEFDAAEGSAVIPNVGDFVEIVPMGQTTPTAFSGRVRSRLFRYFIGEEMKNCGVNIVVEEADDDWGKLIKE